MDNLMEIPDSRIMEMILLDSMYPNQWRADDLQIQQAIDNQMGSKVISGVIGGVFHVIGGQLDIHVQLPEGYPETGRVNVHVRITDGNYSNHVQKDLNERIKKDINDGLCNDLISTVQLTQRLWNDIKEYATNCVNNANESSASDNEHPYGGDKFNMNNELSRYWIYSHHIKSMTKRKYLIDLASQLRLHGFTHVGKPGFICVEGSRDSCESFWGSIRSLNWQKISLIETEILNNTDDESVSSSSSSLSVSSVFTSYDEICDNSQLFRILEEKRCASIVKNYLGLK